MQSPIMAVLISERIPETINLGQFQQFLVGKGRGSQLKLPPRAMVMRIATYLWSWNEMISSPLLRLCHVPLLGVRLVMLTNTMGLKDGVVGRRGQGHGEEGGVVRAMSAGCQQVAALHHRCFVFKSNLWLFLFCLCRDRTRR